MKIKFIRFYETFTFKQQTKTIYNYAILNYKSASKKTKE